MKMLWCHDGPINKFNNEYYGISLNNEVFKRYFYFADQITVACRINNLSDYKEVNNYSKIDLKNTSFLELPNCSTLKGILRDRRKAKTMLKKVIKEMDIVVIRLPSILGFIAVNLAIKYNKKYIIELVACPWDSLWYYGNIQGKIMAPLEFLLTKKHVKKAKNVIYVSKFFLQKRYPNFNNNVGCSDVLLEEPNKMILEKRINKIKKMKNNQIVLGLIGGLEISYRGHDVAIKILSELKKKNIDCIFRFLGKGKNDKIVKMAEKYGVQEMIEFSGVLPSGDKVFEWIDEIDILVMPTKQETLGRAVIEAMSRGCPILGSYETGIPEQIGSDCVFYAKDYINFSDKIEFMINNKQYMQYCAEENFYRSHKYMSVETDKVRKHFYKKCLEK